MSAFMVDKAHVDALVRLGLEGPSGYHGGPSGAWPVPFRWYEVGPQASREEWDITA